MPRAGLDADAVAEAGAALADEVGLDQVTMSLVSERLGVRAPSLYKHVASLADLRQRIATLAVVEIGDRLREAVQGRSGKDALVGAATALRGYVLAHPGRQAATMGATPTGPADAFAHEAQRTLAALASVLHGYHLDPADEVHALRMLRSSLFGFAMIEVAGGLQMDTEPDDSFAWMIDRLDHALRAQAQSPTLAQERRDDR